MDTAGTVRKEKAMATTNRSNMYVKVHYPYLYQPGADKICAMAQRAVVLIRDPFDSGFSEFIR